MEGHQQGSGKAASVVATPGDLSDKKSNRSKEEQRKHQQHLKTVNNERDQTSELLMGIELGAHTSAVVCGAAKTVEETECAESDPRITKAYAPSWVAFDRQIITYGEEAAAYTTITPRETLANLPLWLTVEDVNQAQELEERVKCAPYPRVRLRRGNISFEIHQDAESKEVPLAVALGLLLQHLQVLGDSSGKEHRRRVVKLTGSLQMSSYDAASSVIRHPAAACIVVPSATSPQNVEALQAAACIAGLSPPYLLRRIDALINRFVCEKLDHIYHHFWQQRQKLLRHHHPHHRNALRRDVYVALLDFNFLETSLAVLRLHSLASASSVDDSGATTAERDQEAEEETQRQQGRITCAVLAQRVDATIGFSDVISSVAHHVAAHLKKHCDGVVKSHTRDSWRLHAACVRAIEELYDVEETMIDLDNIVPEGTNTDLRLTQHHFEKICQPLAEHVERFVRDTLNRTGVSPDQLSLTEIASVSRCARMRWLLQRLDRMRGVDAAAPSARAAAAAETAAGEAAQVEAAAAAESACPAGLPGISPELFSFPTQLRFLQSSAAAAVGALYFCAARGQFAPALLQKPQLDHAKRLDREEGNPAAAGNDRIHEATAEVWRSMAADARAEDGEDIGALSQIAHHLLAQEAKELRRRSIAAYLDYHGGTPCDVFGETEKPKHHHHQRDSGSSSSGGGRSNSEERDAEGKGILERMQGFLRRVANASQEEVQEKCEELRAFLLREHTHKAQTLTQETGEFRGAKREHRQETLEEETEKAQQDEEEGALGEEEEAAAAPDAEEDDVGASNSASIKEKKLKELPLREPHVTMDMQRLMLELKVYERKDKPLRYYLDKLNDNIKEARCRNDNGHSDLALYLAQRAADTLQQILSLQENADSGSSSRSQSAWLKVIEVDIQVEMARALLALAEVEHAVSLRKQKLYDAVKHCDNALSKSPDRPEAFYCRSKAFLLLGEYRQAYEDCTAGVALAPHDKHMQGLRLVIERYIEVEERPGT